MFETEKELDQNGSGPSLVAPNPLTVQGITSKINPTLSLTITAYF